MEKTEMFKTSDGQLFEEQQEAEKHEATLKNAERIEKFLDACYPLVGEGQKQGPARSMAKTAVEKFLEGDF